MTFEDILRALPADQEVDPDDTLAEDKMCIVCLTNKKNIQFKPCGHIASCSFCTAKMVQTNGTCPLCREFLTGAEKAQEE